MKNDFQHLEDDMGHLSSKMSEIRDSSDGINQALSDRKQQITKLSSVHHLLKKVINFKSGIKNKQNNSHGMRLKWQLKADSHCGMNSGPLDLAILLSYENLVVNVD